MESNVSTVAFQSNLYPVEKSLGEDFTFRSKIHDPFSLEILKKQFSLTTLQEREYRHASVHCMYAAPNDYPWGTIRNAQGLEQVVCRCLNTECIYFQDCRPDFDPAELVIQEENKKTQPAIFKLDKAVRKKYMTEDEDSRAAAKLFAGDPPEYENTTDADVVRLFENRPASDDPFIARSPIVPVTQPVSAGKIIDFGSFVETTQTEIIEAEPAERIIVNAGPGTGKTWTLIEKIIYMINRGGGKCRKYLGVVFFPFCCGSDTYQTVCCG